MIDTKDMTIDCSILPVSIPNLKVAGSPVIQKIRGCEPLNERQSMAKEQAELSVPSIQSEPGSDHT